MNKSNRFHNLIRGLSITVLRFPFTSMLLVAAAAVNAVSIASDKEHFNYLFTFLVGALWGIVMQVVYERFCEKAISRLTLMVGAGLLTFGYYLIVRPTPESSTEITAKTFIALFALFIAFIWIPSIKSETTFNDSFLIAFKSFFISLFYSLILFAGMSIIITAVDRLLFKVHSDSYSHTANIIFIVFAPMYFLSLIPVYPGKRDINDSPTEKAGKESQVIRLSECPRFLEILLSYIIIPLTSVFTIILILYIVLNLSGDFWADNLLEPMIITYSVVVILVYILVSKLNNRFAVIFRKIMPKILTPIVLFQIIASVLKITDTGLTHNRYFVILYGIFACLSGIILSTVSLRKNGIIAILIIVFSLISIVPPVDAFTVSRMSQIALLENILEKNNMLEQNEVKPKSDLREEDKDKIRKLTAYLWHMGYTDKISWLPGDFNYYYDFGRVFGFDDYSKPGEIKYVSLRLDYGNPIDVSGYDYLVTSQISIIGEEPLAENVAVMKKGGKTLTLSKKISDGNCLIILTDENNTELLAFELTEILDKFLEYSDEKVTLTLKEATFVRENESAEIAIIIQSLNIEKSTDFESYNSDIHFLIGLKR